VKVFSLIDEARANEGHEVLTANQAADPADVGVVSDEIRAITVPPDCSFDESGNRLAMAAKDFPRAVNEKQRVVEGVNAGARIEFVAADHNVGIGLGCSIAQAVGVLAGNQQRVIVEADANGDPLLQFGGPALCPIGIAGQPGFRKGNQLGTLCSGFRYFLARALNRLLAVKVHGRSLNDGNFDFASAT
jgi:hypothetical protein